MKRYKLKTGIKSALLILSLLLVHVSLAHAAPAFQAAGTAENGTGAVSPAWPAHAIGDIALLFVESRGEEAVTLSTPAGFVQVTNSPQFVNTGTNGTRLTVFWARATSTSMTAPTVADPGNHVIAQILTYRGVINTGDPWDITGGGSEDVSDTSLSATGVTTTVADTLIVVAVAQGRDANSTTVFSGWTNANLTNINERTDYANNTGGGDGGGFGVMDGVKATAGATGDTAATLSNAFRKAFLTIALKPPIVGAPSKLAFYVQPSDTECNITMTPEVQVEIQDESGNRVTTATNEVTIDIGTNPVGGTLIGTLTANAVAGVATFSDLKINTAGNGYTLTANATDLADATSISFNITAGACAYSLTQCAGSRFGNNLGCTANDVQITNISIVGGLGFCEGGSTITVDLAITVNSGSPDRYDVGIFISNDGSDPQLTSAASCSVGILPTTDPPFRNTDPGPWSGITDICGDVNGTMNGGTGSGTFTMYNIDILCRSLAGAGGKLYIPFVVSWDQRSSPSGGTCTSAANPVPGTVSKCNAPTILQGSVGVVVLPTITKTDSKTTLVPGETTNYTVVISNTTGITLSGAVFRDTADPSDSFSSSTVTNCVTTGGATCPSPLTLPQMTLPDMPNNSSITFTIQATVKNPSYATFTNTASVIVAEPATSSEADRTVSAIDTNGGSGSGSGGSKVRVIKWREVFQ